LTRRAARRRGLPTPPRGCQPEEHEKSLIEPQNIFVIQPADSRANLRLWDSGDLVRHQTARRAQAVALVRFN